MIESESYGFTFVIFVLEQRMNANVREWHISEITRC